MTATSADSVRPTPGTKKTALERDFRDPRNKHGDGSFLSATVTCLTQDDTLNSRRRERRAHVATGSILGKNL